MSTRTNVLMDKIFVFEKNKVMHEKNGDLKKLVLETPVMTTKFGFDDNYGKTYLKLDFLGINTNKKVPEKSLVNKDKIKEFYELILLIEYVLKEKLETYYKSYSETEEIDIEDFEIFVKTNFYDKNHDYDPIFKVKLPKWENEYKTVFKYKGKESSIGSFRKKLNNKSQVKCKIEAEYIYNKKISENLVNAQIVWTLKEIDFLQ